MTLPTQVDVLVSEWMGHFLFSERMLEPLLTLRDAFLRRGGRMIPSRCSLHLGLVATPTHFEELSFLCTRPYDIDFSAVGDWPFREVSLLRIEATELLPETCSVADCDLYTITETPRLLTGTVVPESDATVYGLCGWFDAQLSPNQTLSTSPFARATHWTQFHFPFDRPLDVFARQPVDLKIEIVFEGEYNAYTWQARSAGGVRNGSSVAL